MVNFDINISVTVTSVWCIHKAKNSSEAPSVPLALVLDLLELVVLPSVTASHSSVLTETLAKETLLCEELSALVDAAFYNIVLTKDASSVSSPYSALHPYLPAGGLTNKLTG